MNKKNIWLVIFLASRLFPAFAQSFGSVDYDKADAAMEVDSERGFSAQVEVNTNLFQSSLVAFSDEKERFLRSGYDAVNNYPFGGINVLDGTGVGFAYNGGWYGGNVSVNAGGLGGIKAWMGFIDNKIKISAGNDIGYAYADSQGADAGLRVYDDSVRNEREGEEENPSIDTSKNPDNITRDQGVLFELNLDPFKLALAAGGNFSDMAKNMGNVQMYRTGTYEIEPVYGRSLQYGINIGGRVGDYAKINGAYIVQSDKNESRYEYIQADKKLVPRQADAEITSHLFGAYGSVYPFGDSSMGITLGYAGVWVQYLEEFSAGSETVKPQIMKNGFNLTARYQTDKFMVKTDHNYSFWNDKNYRIFQLHKPHVSMRDYGLRSADTNAADFADVSHSFLWNGIGASVQCTSVIEGSLYTRNLIRIDETPRYRMLNDYFSAELRSTFRFSPAIEAYMGFVFKYTGRTASAELSEDVNEFSPGNTAQETNDSMTMIQVPIGIKVKLQR